MTWQYEPGPDVYWQSTATGAHVDVMRQRLDVSWPKYKAEGHVFLYVWRVERNGKLLARGFTHTLRKALLRAEAALAAHGG
jgi:hypothetical protein